MKHLAMRALILFMVLSLGSTQNVMAQGFLKKLKKATESVVSTSGQETENTQANDTVEIKIPEFDIRKNIILDEKGDTLRYDDGTVKYQYLVYDYKKGVVLHPETVEREIKIAIKSIWKKVGIGAAAGAGATGIATGAFTGNLKKAAIGAAVGAAAGAAGGFIASAKDRKNLKELKKQRAELGKYQETFTEEGFPINADADLSEYANNETISLETQEVAKMLAASKEEGNAIEDVDFSEDELEELAKEEA